MRTFLTRFGIYMVLWVTMIYEASSHVSLSILLMTASLALFFFLSNDKSSIYIYLSIVVILCTHGFIMNEVLYTYLLLLFIIFISSTRLFQKQFVILCIFTFVSFVILAYPHTSLLLYLTFTTLLFAVLLFRLHVVTIEKNETVEIYEQLLSEYRQVKRINVSLEEGAKAEERTRIARDIHDSVGHRLTALIMKLEMLRIKEGNKVFEELKGMAEESLQETREAVQALEASEATGITAVVQLIRKLEAESNLLIQFTLKEGILSTPLTNDHGIVLYRVFQEALTNVMRHSTSKHVGITIGKSATNSIQFSIVNPYKKMEKVEDGFGLSTMKKRMEEIGGELHIEQTKDEFMVRGIMPYE